MLIREFFHGWSILNQWGQCVFEVFVTRSDAMRHYVYQCHWNDLKKIMGREPNNRYDVPLPLIRKIWRNDRLRGEVRLVKSTSITAYDWIDPNE